MTENGKPFVVLYRWKLKKGKEAGFTQAWQQVTRHFLKNCGSLGSRLHRGDDGLFYAYAMWPSREARDNAFSTESLERAALVMRESAIERLPDVELDILADLIKG